MIRSAGLYLLTHRKQSKYQKKDLILKNIFLMLISTGISQQAMHYIE